MPQSWGPAEEDVLTTLISERQASWDTDHVADDEDAINDNGEHEGEDDYNETDSEDEECGELFYASELSAIADAYRESSDELFPGVWEYDTRSPFALNTSSISRSPRKRHRVD